MCPLFISTDMIAFVLPHWSLLYISVLLFYRRVVGIRRCTLYLSALELLPCSFCRMIPLQQFITYCLAPFISLFWCSLTRRFSWPLHPQHPLAASFNSLYISFIHCCLIDYLFPKVCVHYLYDPSKRERGFVPVTETMVGTWGMLDPYLLLQWINEWVAFPE